MWFHNLFFYQPVVLGLLGRVIYRIVLIASLDILFCLYAILLPPHRW